MSGGPYRSIVPSDEDAFQLLSGELTIYNKIGDSGNARELAFCNRCGSHIYATSKASSEPGVADLLACVPECSRKLLNLCQRFRSGAIRVCPGSMNLTRFRVSRSNK